MILKKTSTAITLLAIILTIIALLFINNKYQTFTPNIPKFNHTISVSPHAPEPAKNTAKNGTDQKSSIINLKSSILLPVPFTPQAPTANWDQLHNEACEEAVAIMSAAYFSSSTAINLEPNFVESEIAKLTKWEDANFGYHLDTTSAETAQMIESVYGLKTKIISNFTDDDIKNELAQNHLVIISENGQQLGNPFYKQPGPIHHMLLIKGFDGNNLITNDSGTKRGLNYVYDFSTVYNAAADWSHALDTVDSNKKIAIVVWK